MLARKPFNPSTPHQTLQALQLAVTTGELQGTALTRLALQTLGSFNLSPHPLLDFLRDHVMPYLEDNDNSIRRATALAACHVLEEYVKYAQRPGGRQPAAQQRAVDKMMQHLLQSAIADPVPGVRRTVLEVLVNADALDTHIAQAESLHSLFVAFNDESSRVRSLAIQLAGHISSANPAYVMPALRRHLMQLLTDMDHSPDARQKEGVWLFNFNF